MLGKLIRGSGREFVISEAGVFTSGGDVSTLDDHIKRTQYAQYAPSATSTLNPFQGHVMPKKMSQAVQG